ncbi:MAG: hypothetical protein ACU0DW_07150 [Shimia sp.]
MLAFLISIAAGYLARYARATIEELLEKLLLDKVDIAKDDSLALSYALCLLGASVVFAILGAEIPAVAVLLGGLLGLFGNEIYAAVMKQVKK